MHVNTELLLQINGDSWEQRKITTTGGDLEIVKRRQLDISS